MRHALLLTATLLAVPGTALAQADYDTKAAIEAMTAKWEAALNAGDAAAMTGLYAKDAALMPPGGEPVKGHDAITEVWGGMTSEGVTGKLKAVEVYGMGDMAVEVGTYTLNSADGSHLDHGKYMVLYKKVDGEWYLYRDMWNSSMSP